MKRLTYKGLMCMACVALLRGCECSEDVPVPITPWSCKQMDHRPGPDVRACDADQRFAKGECLPLRCDAGEQPPGCCPGMFCTQGGECVVPPSRITRCQGDGECEEGLRCLDRPLVDSESKTCGYPHTDVHGHCPNGGQPFNGRCVAGPLPPCAGDCPTGTVCNIDKTRVVEVNGASILVGGDCEEPPSLFDANHGCDQECGEAQILVYSDPDTMLWERCCAVTCECLTLPPLGPGRWGRYSDLAVNKDALLVSAYDATYGDLVLGTHGRVSGQLKSLEYIDGLPSGGTTVADPAGPRAGRIEPGPDVGAYTAIALYHDAPRITYFDLEHANLKYATFAADTGTWQSGLVDDGRDDTGADTGDVGRFSSLLIDDKGIAHVTYFAHRVVSGDELRTGPVYARALNSDPLVYEDWERIPIEMVASCDSACAGNDLCVVEDGAPTCAAPRDDCNTACACDETCVQIAGLPVCRRHLPASLAVPCDGSCPASFVCVADQPSGTLCLLERDGECGGCTEGEACVDDGAGNPICRRQTPYSTLTGLPKGVGLFTSLVLYQNKPTVVYYDSLLGQLRGAMASFAYDQPASDFVALPMPVGCASGSDNGQSASLAVAPDGTSLAVAYQGDAGDTLWFYQGSDLWSGTSERVDDGLRSPRLDRVGASASLAFGASAAEPYIAYADQTNNDLLLAYKNEDTWRVSPQLTDGAFGSFARMKIDGRTAWMTTYRRERDELDRDTSHLVVHTISLDSLP